MKKDLGKKLMVASAAMLLTIGTATLAFAEETKAVADQNAVGTEVVTFDVTKENQETVLIEGTTDNIKVNVQTVQGIDEKQINSQSEETTASVNEENKADTSADVTEKKLIDFTITGEAGKINVSKNDDSVINKYFNVEYSYFDGTYYIFNDSTKIYMNWDNMSAKYEDLGAVRIYGLSLERDGNDALSVKYYKDIAGAFAQNGGYGDFNPWYHMIDGIDLNAGLDLVETKGLAGVGDMLDYDESYGYFFDVYVVRVETKDGAWYQEYFVPNDHESVLTIAAENQTNDSTGSDVSGVLEIVLQADNTIISSDNFQNIIAENATKDVVIKTANDVTFTFAKGTMSAVEGKTEYDFGVTIINDYIEAKKSYNFISQSNFITQITYNYSGKLPATAKITFNVGKENAGKTLYYSKLFDGGIRYIQQVTVDGNGYITVSQDSCSTYVLSTTNPENKYGNSPKTYDAGCIELINYLAKSICQ